MIEGVVDGKVRIVRLLGRGGMGAVYEGEDVRSGQRVAVKVMHPRGEGDDDGDDQLGRFQREARAAAAIAGEHVARVIDWGTDPERAAPYMVMEYLEGEDLHALLKRAGALRPDAALRIAAQACLGVAQAHEARVIHRDIKPANLFLARQADGRVVVKILDFGIAKIRPEREGGETTGLTRTGGMLGSPIYMSPEQARGLKAIDYRTDLWSLGVVLYRALSGHTPHDETEALGDLILAICSSVPRPVQEVAPWVPAGAATVVHGALQIHPDDRWPSASAMLDAIRPSLPHGWELRQEMLVAVDDATRATVAPRAPEIPAASITAGGRRASAATSVPPPRAASVRPPANQEEEPVPASTAAGSARRPRWRSRAMAATAAGLVAGGAYYGATHADRTGAPGAAGVASSVAASAEPPAGRAVEARPAVVETAHVKLAVFPRDATVEVDDAGAPVHDGAVEIRGAPGSVHRVRVSRGALEASVDVVVTDGGAVPPRVELGLVRPAAPRPGPAPGATAAATTPTPGPSKPLIPDRFE